MFSRVLFPTDFSAYADAVLACLPEMKSTGLREVVLLSVIRTADVPLPETLNRESLEFWRWNYNERLNIAKMALEGKGFRILTRIEYGSPAEQIVHVAEEERVDLIIIGAQGVTAAQELLLGSTAYEVVRRATVPVLIQKFEVVRQLGHIKCQQLCEHLFEKVLHPTDFSDCAQGAFQIVKNLKSAGTQEVILLHVQDIRSMKHRSVEQLREFDEIDLARLKKLCKTLKMCHLEARPILRHGIPYKETITVAEEQNATLIVMGSQGRSALQEMLTGSTFDNVARLSHVPVLVIKPQ